MEIVVFALSALVLILAALALAVPAARAIGLPLPVMVAATGMVAGTLALALEIPSAAGVLDAYDLWFLDQLALNSETMLYLFLPPLLFEMALAVDVRRMLDEIRMIVVMAIFAVATATLVVGYSVWAVSSLSLTACLLLGAAVATTDPAAVITTFREIGAPRRLMVILEGESLLNDAAAIAIFTLILSLTGAAAAGTAAPGFALGLLYTFGGGVAVGLGLSWLASRLYPLLGRSAVAETSMTVALAYGAYLLAERGLGVSGVVAVVFAGLATGSVGFIRMGPRNWHDVRTVWAQVGFWAGTVVLLLASLLTPQLLAALHWRQAALGVVVYLGAIAARAMILYGALPVLDLIGRRPAIGEAQKALILWGGVRGPVTLVLALSLTEISALGPDGPVVGALAAAFTLTTLFLNAATLHWLTHRLGLDRLSPADQALRDLIIAGVIDDVRATVADLAAERRMDAAALAAVEDDLLEQRASAEAEAEVHARGLRIPFGERLRLGLAILSGQEARLIRSAFESGAIGPRTTLLLRLSADRIADAARSGGRAAYQRAAAEAVTATEGYRLAYWLHRFLRLDWWLRDLIEFRLTALMETERLLQQMDRFAASTLTRMVGEEAAENLRALLASRLEMVREQSDLLALQYPRYAAALETALIRRAAIRRERQQYERLFRDGVIGQELLDDLLRGLARRERGVALPPRLDLTLSAVDLMHRVPFLGDLTEAQRRRVARRLRVRVTRPGEVVLARDARATALVLVASGALELRGRRVVRRLSNGDFLGEQALLSPGWRAPGDVVSLGFSRLLTLSRNDFLRLERRDPDLGRRIRARLAAGSAPRPAARA